MSKLVPTRHIKLHSIPGSIHSLDGVNEGPAEITGYSWDAAGWETFSLSHAELGAWQPDPRRVYWINITAFRNSELLGTIQQRFGIHPLIAEDIANFGHRPKIETYPGYRFVIAKMLRMEKETILTEQISMVQFDNVLMSFQEAPGDVFAPIRRRIEDGSGRIRSGDAEYLLFALLDAVVDNYIHVTDFMGGGIEDFEDRIFDRQDSGVIGEIRKAKSTVAEIRRHVQPLNDALALMLGADGPEIDSDVLPFYTDLRDHLEMVSSAATAYRDMLRDQLNLFTALQNYRLSEVMKILTVISTIFIPLTFMAGIYGMNFAHMPELAWPFGYPLLLGIMGALSVVMLILFRRKGWLGRLPPARRGKLRKNRPQP